MDKTVTGTCMGSQGDECIKEAFPPLYSAQEPDVVTVPKLHLPSQGHRPLKKGEDQAYASPLHGAGRAHRHRVEATSS